MGSLTVFISIYIFGGLTFFPSVLILFLSFAYITLPKPTSPAPDSGNDSDRLRDSKDDGQNIKSITALQSLEEKFHRGHESDVAAGYFAVCREYVPGGINGKPPERTTPAGAVVASESQSVYQSMYRSLFDRKQGLTFDPSKSSSRPAKRARNVFFVVLRHGHLMLYDDSEQLEVRHVISLEHHIISVYGGGDEIPEGELWIKRNAICLSRKPSAEDVLSLSRPFYLFSENCSEKEDFYFALLQNQDARLVSSDSPPRPQHYRVKDIITLVQKLHSSEEQLQTRWINALIGRLFLALYQTRDIENFIRKKVTKKIARVKKPAFLSGIVLQKIDMGESAPHITNPRLKDLTIDGDCCVEADFKYSGNFQLEIATTARIDLGARFKAREVNLVLAAVVKRLEGHVLIKFKPPPSNRIWITFETMPDIDLNIEPIVSSRQITYNIILRAIQSRIREVIAETVVLPHWDDSPFTDTSHQEYRGGIWAPNPYLTSPPSRQTEVPDEAAEDEAESSVDATALAPTSPRFSDERTMSLPALSDPTIPSVISPTAAASTQDLETTSSPGNLNDGVASAAQKNPEPPKAMRSRSFASAADPLLSMDHANVESLRKETKSAQQQDATSAMKAISCRSRPISPVDEPANSCLSTTNLEEQTQVDVPEAVTPQSSLKPDRTNIEQVNNSPLQASFPPSPASINSSFAKSISGGFSRQSTATLEDTQPLELAEKKSNLSSISAATAAAAKEWGWSVLSRSKEYRRRKDPSPPAEEVGTPAHPIGRGRPLPPPGQPLPRPPRSNSKSSQLNPLRRRPVARSSSAPRQQSEISIGSENAPSAPVRRCTSTSQNETDFDNVLVVAAPSESLPSSPVEERGEDYMELLEDIVYSKN